MSEEDFNLGMILKFLVVASIIVLLIIVGLYFGVVVGYCTGIEPIPCQIMMTLIVAIIAFISVLTIYTIIKISKDKK